MPSYVFSRKPSDNNTVFLGLTKDFAKTFDASSPHAKNVIFCASIDKSSDIPLFTTFISNIYIDTQKVVYARKYLETLVSKIVESQSNSNLVAFSIWFSFPLPNTTKQFKLTKEPIYNNEMMLTDVPLSDTSVNDVVTEMAKNGFPIMAKRIENENAVEPHQLFRERIHLAYCPESLN
jgi:hypothetical protein